MPQEIKAFCVGASVTGQSLLGLVVKFLLVGGGDETILLPRPQTEKLIELLATHLQASCADLNPDVLESEMAAAASSLSQREVESVSPARVITHVSVVENAAGYLELGFKNRAGASIVVSARPEFAEWLIGYLANVLASVAKLSRPTGTLN